MGNILCCKCEPKDDELDKLLSDMYCSQPTPKYKYVYPIPTTMEGR